MHKQNTRRGYTHFFPVPLAGKVACQAVRGAHKGFTLIELLVVVLIIGILAAVAVPQYKIATDKARLSKLVSMLPAVVTAQETYYLSNGKYTQHWKELDVTFPGKLRTFSQLGDALFSDEGWQLTLTSSSGVAATHSLLQDITIYHFYPHHPTAKFQNRQVCYATATNPYANKLCQSLSSKSTWDDQAGYGTQNIYFLN